MGTGSTRCATMTPSTCTKLVNYPDVYQINSNPSLSLSLHFGISKNIYFVQKEKLENQQFQPQFPPKLYQNLDKGMDRMVKFQEN